uniref:glutathione transferase n=1 Tax=Piliocolobus tephrosceles TaxID=591936 RepID=A0A8C9GR25_9PRIM
MTEKPKLHYLNARGRMESTRWLLAAAGVEVGPELRHLKWNLLPDGSLLFQQVPIVEIDGMKLVQTRAILNYIASKYNLYGKDIKERALIDMYTEGIVDLTEMVFLLITCQPEERDAKTALVKEKIQNRYFPAFEKVSETVHALTLKAFYENRLGEAIVSLTPKL